MKERVHFGGRLGVLLVATGSAVGLGNIWRFPYELGQNGGGAFLLVYLFCALIIGLPIMLSEFAVGRRGQSNVVGAFRKVSGTNRWRWIGYLGVLCAFLIMGFYAVVCGWTLDYVYQSIAFGFQGMTPDELSNAFAEFSTQSFRPLFWMILFLCINAFVVIAGVRNGIERTSKILMPIFLLIVVVMCIRSITLPGGIDGLRFLFYSDFSKITPKVVLSAMGQAFFSLSLGMGCMMTYGSYIAKDVNLGRSVVEITIFDTIVSLLASLVIFPAVFAMGINPSQGPELVFITFPNVFNHIQGGYFWAILFFLLLSIAALTSTISLLEVITAFVTEELRITRRKAVVFITLFIAVLATVSSLSIGSWGRFSITIGGESFFEVLDNLTARIMMPLTGLAIALFVGWRMKRSALEREITNEHTIRAGYFKIFLFVLKFITPLAIVAVFADQFLSWL